MIPTVGENPPADSNTREMFVVAFCPVIQFHLHDCAQLVGLRAVHRQHQRLFQERIADPLDVFSRETIPSRRAFCAYPTISFTT